MAFLAVDEMPPTTDAVAPGPSRLDKPSTKGKWQKFVSIIWDADYYDKSDAERHLVFKLDCTLLTILTFGWWLKYIDQTNISFAYVSGMKEDLGMNQNQYTYAFTIYNAVYCVLQLPSNLVILKVRPSYWLAGCELGWMAFTFAQAGAQNPTHVYIFRFFIGFFEAAFQPVSFFLLGSWYTKTELGKRVSLWFIAGTAGSAFSGFMQAAIYETLDGVAGLAGWRWLYLICGFMTLPVGLATFVLLPDHPHNCRSRFLTAEERAMAIERCATGGQKPVTGFIKWSLFKDIVKTWHFWVIVPAYLFYATSIQAYNYFAIYLKAAGYSVSMRNVLPGFAFLIQIPAGLTYGWLSDRTGSRFCFTFFPLVWQLVPNIILAVWPSGDKIKVFAFMIIGTTYVTHIFYTWVNEICRANTEERAFIIGCCQTLFFAFNAWLPTVVFLQTEGPSFRKGFPTVLASGALACIAVFVMWRLHKRQLAQEEMQLDEATTAENLDREKAPEEAETGKNVAQLSVLPVA